MNKTNEELACLRVVFTLSVVVDVSVLGWLAQNYRTAHWPILSAAAIVAMVLTLIAIISAHAVLSRLRTMEK